MTGANRATLQADSLDATNQGSDLLVRVSGAAAGDQGVIVVSQRLAFESLLGGTMLVHPGYVTGVVNITADQKGEASLMIFGPVTTDLPRLYLQAAFGSSQLSNGLRLDLRFPQ
jgi:hypothetical protein